MPFRQKTKRPKKVLAVCSGGGHWIQMKRLQPAFEGIQLTYATVHRANASEVRGAKLFLLPDANRDTKARLCLLLLKLMWIVVRVRPDVVVSTGAAPGYLAIRIARLLGARTLFLDSIANAEELSMSAAMAVSHADVTLSQWDNVAQKYGLQHWGAVL
jgi:UDP-N-acetylglucosamine:LPS N-acetylglucosamine transferase